LLGADQIEFRCCFGVGLSFRQLFGDHKVKLILDHTVRRRISMEKAEKKKCHLRFTVDLRKMHAR
jgi:hypothetical protein